MEIPSAAQHVADESEFQTVASLSEVPIPIFCVCISDPKFRPNTRIEDMILLICFEGAFAMCVPLNNGIS